MNLLYQYPQNIPNIFFFRSRTAEIFFAFISSLLPPDECEVGFQRSTCLGATPPCNPENGLLLSVCPNSCNARNRLFIEGTCTELFEYVGLLQEQSNLEDLRIFLDLLFSFDCYNTSTYIFYDDRKVDPDQCYDIFRPGQAG